MKEVLMRMRSVIGRSVLPVVVCLLVSGCGGGKDDHDGRAVIATVGGEKILERDVKLIVDTWKKSEEAQAAQEKAPLPDKRLRQLALLQLVKMRYVESRADEEGVRTRADELARASSAAIGSDFSGSGWEKTGFESAVRLSILSKALAEKLFPTAEVDSAKVHRYYDDHPELFNGSWKATVDMAFFAAKPAQPLPGGTEFAGAARQAGAADVISDQPVNAISPLPPEVLALMPTMKAGTVSAPVQAGKGFWVIFARSIEHTPQSFDQARPSIETHLADQERQSRFETWLTDELRAADVQVSEEYGKWPGDWL